MPSPLLDSNQNGTDSLVSSWDLPAVNPHGPNILLIGWVQCRPNRTIVPPSGWTLRNHIDTTNLVAPGYIRYALLDRIVSIPSGPYADTVTFTGGTAYTSAAQQAFRSTGSAVQSATAGSGYQSCTLLDVTVTATLPSAATAGRVLVAYTSLTTCAGNGREFQWPVGWTVIESIPSPNIHIGAAEVAYKVADGGETGVAVTSHQTGNMQLAELSVIVAEYELEADPGPPAPVQTDLPPDPCRPRFRVVIAGMDDNRGPGDLEAIVEDAKNLGVSRYANDSGEVFFTIPLTHPYADAVSPFQQHYFVYRYGPNQAAYAEAEDPGHEFQTSGYQPWRIVAAGLVDDYAVDRDEMTVYGTDYYGLLETSISAASTSYTDAYLGDIVKDQLDQAIAESHSRLAWTDTTDVLQGTVTATLITNYQPRLAFIRDIAGFRMSDSDVKTILNLEVHPEPGTGEFGHWRFIQDFEADRLPAPAGDITATDNVLLEYGGAVRDFRYWTGGGDFATRVFGIGVKREGAGILYSTQTYAPEATYGLIASNAVHYDVVSQAALDKIVKHDAKVAGNRAAEIVLELNVDRDGSSGNRFRFVSPEWMGVGDSVRVAIRRPPLNITGMYNIWGWEWTVDPEGQEHFYLDTQPKISGFVQASVTRDCPAEPRPPHPLDDFDRIASASATGSLPSGSISPGSAMPFSPASSGLVWRQSHVTPSYETTLTLDGDALVAASSDDGNVGAYVESDAYAWAAGPFVMRAKVKVDTITNGPQFNFGVLTPDSEPQIINVFFQNALPDLQLSVVSGASRTTGPATTLTANAWWWIVWDFDPGVHSRVVVYADGSAQPGWQLSLTPDSQQGREFNATMVFLSAGQTARIGWIDVQTTDPGEP